MCGFVAFRFGFVVRRGVRFKCFSESSTEPKGAVLLTSVTIKDLRIHLILRIAANRPFDKIRCLFSYGLTFHIYGIHIIKMISNNRNNLIKTYTNVILVII